MKKKILIGSIFVMLLLLSIPIVSSAQTKEESIGKVDYDCKEQFGEILKLTAFTTLVFVIPVVLIAKTFPRIMRGMCLTAYISNTFAFPFATAALIVEWVEICIFGVSPGEQCALCA
ncbi:MAG: hypothetical protein JSW62_04155 [Thermoplasmatales archaeon]|nr:MAG: hypothetical protein JSW62_04155 [Thermoplasmatales archaeon]